MHICYNEIRSSLKLVMKYFGIDQRMVLDPVGSVPGPDTTSETVSGSGYDSSEKTDLHPTLEELPDPI